METELRRMDDHRFDRIETKLDQLEAHILKLWQNGLSEQAKRISSLEAHHAACQMAQSRGGVKTQQWLTVVGWVFTIANSMGVAVMVYLLNSVGKGTP